MKINTRSITLAATLVALCCVTGLIPYVFFLPVMVAVTTLSVGMVAFVGLAFGAVSVAYSFIMPASPVSAAFIQAPYIAIFPRILAALGAFGVFKPLQKFAKPVSKPARFATASAASAVGSLLNTALVVSMFVLIMPDDPALIAYIPTMLVSGAIEFACMAVLVPPISMTLDKAVFKRNYVKKTVTPDAQSVQARTEDLRGAPAPDSATAETASDNIVSAVEQGGRQNDAVNLFGNGAEENQKEKTDRI